MKRFIALLLAALLCLGCCAVGFAEEPEFTAEDVPPLETPGSGKDPGMRAYSAADSVVISGNSYSVVTPEGIAITYTAPNSNVYCLTQDLANQYPLYDAFYSSPVSICAQFIDTGMHLNIFDVSTQSDVYVFVSSADWANLSDVEANIVMDYLTQYAISGVQDATVGTAGDNIYFYVRTADEVYLVTSVNGYQVYVCFAAPNQDAVLAGLSLLDNLSIYAV